MQILEHSGGAGKTNAAPGNAIKAGRPQPPEHQAARPKLVSDLAKLKQAPLTT